MSFFKPAAYPSLFFVLLGMSLLHGQEIDRLRTLASNTDDPSERIATWQEMAFQFLYIDADSAEVYARKSLDLALEQRLDSLIAEAYLMVGNYFYLTTQLDSALPYYEKAAETHKAGGRKDRYAATLTNMGGLYQNKWNYPKALELMLKASVTFAELEDSFRLATIHANLANVYDKNDQPREAIQYARMSQAYSSKHFDQARMEAHYYQAATIIGGAYMSLGKADSGIYFQRIAALGFERVQDPFNRLSATNNLAYAYEVAQKPDSAAIFYEKATQMAVSLDIPDRIMGNASNAADLFVNTGALDKAKKYLQLAEAQAEKVEDPEMTYRLLKTRSRYDEAKGNYAEALKTQRLAHQMIDSLNSRERTKAMSELRVKFETAEKERQLAQASADLRQRQLYITWLVGLLIAAILLGLILGIVGRARQRTAIQQAQLSEQKKGLKAVIQATEGERRRIARDLHDGVGQELASLQMAFEQVRDERAQKDMDEFQTRLKEATSHLRSISHQMMPRSLEVAGLAAAMEELVEKSTKGTGIKGQYDSFRVPEYLPEDISLVAYRVAQELINNVLKHSGADELDVLLTLSSGQLSLSVEDNGKGMEPTGNSEGIGMANMRSRLETVAGSLVYEEAENSGTRALVKIPLEDA